MKKIKTMPNKGYNGNNGYAPLLRVALDVRCKQKEKKSS